MLKKVKNRRFDYVPRYYDPAKEELEERMAPYREGADATDRAKAGIKTGFNRKTPVKQSDLRKGSKKATLRLFLIIGILVLLTYKLLESEGIRRFLESLE